MFERVVYTELVRHSCFRKGLSGVITGLQGLTLNHLFLPLLFPQDLQSFFREETIVFIRIPKESEGGRMKGFALVDFETRDDLIQALARNEELLKNRKLKVDLADAPRDGQAGRLLVIVLCRSSKTLLF